MTTNKKIINKSKVDTTINFHLFYFLTAKFKQIREANSNSNKRCLSTHKFAFISIF